MAYTKTTWVDEVLAGAERFDIKDNVGTPIYSNVQIVLATSVTTTGTSVNAANLNNMEDGIEAISTGVARSVKGVAGAAAGDVADIVASSDNTVLRRSGTTIGFGTVPNAALADHSEEIYLKVFWQDESIEIGDGKVYFTVPPYLNGGTIVDLDIAIYVASTSGLPTVQVHNLGPNPLTAGNDILSTRATVDVGEYNSMNAATQPVIQYPTLTAGDILRIDVDVAGTGAQGLDVFMEVQKA